MLTRLATPILLCCFLLFGSSLQAPGLIPATENCPNKCICTIHDGMMKVDCLTDDEFKALQKSVPEEDLSVQDEIEYLNPLANSEKSTAEESHAIDASVEEDAQSKPNNFSESRIVIESGIAVDITEKPKSSENELNSVSVDEEGMIDAEKQQSNDDTELPSDEDKIQNEKELTETLMNDPDANIVAKKGNQLRPLKEEELQGDQAAVESYEEYDEEEEKEESKPEEAEDKEKQKFEDDKKPTEKPALDEEKVETKTAEENTQEEDQLEEIAIGSELNKTGVPEKQANQTKEEEDPQNFDENKPTEMEDKALQSEDTSELLLENEDEVDKNESEDLEPPGMPGVLMDENDQPLPKEDEEKDVNEKEENLVSDVVVHDTEKNDMKTDKNEEEPDEDTDNDQAIPKEDEEKDANEKEENLESDEVVHDTEKNDMETDKDEEEPDEDTEKNSDEDNSNEEDITEPPNELGVMTQNRESATEERKSVSSEVEGKNEEEEEDKTGSMTDHKDDDIKSSEKVDDEIASLQKNNNTENDTMTMEKEAGNEENTNQKFDEDGEMTGIPAVTELNFDEPQIEFNTSNIQAKETEDEIGVDENSETQTEIEPPNILIMKPDEVNETDIRSEENVTNMIATRNRQNSDDQALDNLILPDGEILVTGNIGDTMAGKIIDEQEEENTETTQPQQSTASWVILGLILGTFVVVLGYAAIRGSINKKKEAEITADSKTSNSIPPVFDSKFTRKPDFETGTELKELSRPFLQPAEEPVREYKDKKEELDEVVVNGKDISNGLPYIDEPNPMLKMQRPNAPPPLDLPAPNDMSRQDSTTTNSSPESTAPEMQEHTPTSPTLVRTRIVDNSPQVLRVNAIANNSEIDES